MLFRLDRRHPLLGRRPDPRLDKNRRLTVAERPTRGFPSSTVLRVRTWERKKNKSFPTNTDNSATPTDTPLVAIRDGVKIWVALGCSSKVFFFYFNTCSGARTTHHYMHTSNIGWVVSKAASSVSRLQHCGVFWDLVYMFLKKNDQSSSMGIKFDYLGWGMFWPFLALAWRFLGKVILGLVKTKIFCLCLLFFCKGGWDEREEDGVDDEVDERPHDAQKFVFPQVDSFTSAPNWEMTEAVARFSDSLDTKPTLKRNQEQKKSLPK